MKTSTKLWLCIAGILLIALGVVCICKPANTLFAAAWLIGFFTLTAGITKLIFTFRTQLFLPNSGTRMLSSILDIIIGLIFLGNNLFVALSLPVVFAVWVMVEGIIIAVDSFDFKRFGFPMWWCLLLLGIAGAVLGCLGLRNPDVSARTLSTLIGIAVILSGAAYLVAVTGVNRFEKRIDDVRRSVGIDEQ